MLGDRHIIVLIGCLSIFLCLLYKHVDISFYSYLAIFVIFYDICKNQILNYCKKYEKVYPIIKFFLFNHIDNCTESSKFQNAI